MQLDKDIQGVIQTVVNDVVIDQAKENIQESMIHSTDSKHEKPQGEPSARVRKRLNIVK